MGGWLKEHVLNVKYCSSSARTRPRRCKVRRLRGRVQVAQPDGSKQVEPALHSERQQDPATGSDGARTTLLESPGNTARLRPTAPIIPPYATRSSPHAGSGGSLCVRRLPPAAAVAVLRVRHLAAVAAEVALAVAPALRRVVVPPLRGSRCG